MIYTGYKGEQKISFFIFSLYHTFGHSFFDSIQQHLKYIVYGQNQT